MDRFSLTDAQWEKMAPFCLGKPTDPEGIASGVMQTTRRVNGPGTSASPERPT